MGRTRIKLIPTGFVGENEDKLQVIINRVPGVKKKKDCLASAIISDYVECIHYHKEYYSPEIREKVRDLLERNDYKITDSTVQLMRVRGCRYDTTLKKIIKFRQYIELGSSESLI